MLNARQRVNALKLLDNSTMTNILAKNLRIFVLCNLVSKSKMSLQTCNWAEDKPGLDTKRQIEFHILF